METMRSLVAVVLIVSCPALALAQGGAGGVGTGGGAAGGGAAGGGAGAAAPATPGVTAPSTTPTAPSQPNAGGGQNPPPSSGGGTARQQGGANSSVESRENRTGKNPLNETYTSCVRMWDTQTHMTRAEWQRACRRVENRLQTLTTK